MTISGSACCWSVPEPQNLLRNQGFEVSINADPVRRLADHHSVRKAKCTWMCLFFGGFVTGECCLYYLQNQRSAFDTTEAKTRAAQSYKEKCSLDNIIPAGSG